MLTHRIFIALLLPKEVKKQLQKLQQEKAAFFPQEIRWLAVSDLHLTLAFLGERTAEETKTITNIIQHLSKKHTALVLKPFLLQNFGAVLALKMLSKKAQKLHQDLVQSFTEQGIEYQKKYQFKPHITIARFSKKIKQRIQYKVHFPAFKVEKIALIKSTLLREGAKHEIIYSFSLKGTTRHL